MQDNNQDNAANCVVCGKPTVKRDIRDRKPTYCSRICAANSRYQTRYRGTLAGPADRPINMADKTKF